MPPYARATSRFEFSTLELTNVSNFQVATKNFERKSFSERAMISGPRPIRLMAKPTHPSHHYSSHSTANIELEAHRVPNRENIETDTQTAISLSAEY